jgi:hypothetical protein
MGFDWKQLRKPSKPHYGFGGKRIETVRAITLSDSFGTPKNPRTEYITFDVVDMTYPYNTIFGRGLLNTFEAALHSAYLCLKIPATFGVITIFITQQEARNNEKGFAPGHKECAFLMRAARVARNSTSGIIHKGYRGRRRVLKGTIGPKSPRQNNMHWHRRQPAGPIGAFEFP